MAISARVYREPIRCLDSSALTGEVKARMGGYSRFRSIVASVEAQRANLPPRAIQELARPNIKVALDDRAVFSEILFQTGSPKVNSSGGGYSFPSSYWITSDALCPAASLCKVSLGKALSTSLFRAQLH